MQRPSEPPVLAAPVGLRRRHVVGYAFLVLVALALSFKISAALFWLDDDSASAALLWEGWRRHGIAWLTHWQFTPDNWLFSSLAVNFLGFFVLGLKPSLVVINGWLFFAAAAAVAGGIAWLLHARRAALVVPVILLLPGYYGYRFGFVSYAISHNVTNLFGLLALLLVLLWLPGRRHLLLAPVLLLLAAGGVSDPWMLVAYCVPLLLLCLLGWLPGLRLLRPVQAAMLLPVAALPIALATTQVFGLLAFVPTQLFQFGSWAVMNANAAYLIRDLGGLLSFVPFQQRDDFITSLVSFTAALGFLGLAAAGAAPAWRRAGQRSRFFLGFTVISVAAIVGGFVLSDQVASDFSGRYLINASYLLILAGGVLADLGWRWRGQAARRGLGALVAIFLVASLTSTATLWFGPFRHAETDAGAWVGFLEANGLNYGYGPYWGTQANAVTVISRGRVVIRPITFNPETGAMIGAGRSETSRLWYLASDVPAGQKTFFVVVASDFEQQVDQALCLRGLAEQFGPPARILPANGVLVLVWNHPLLRG